MTKKEAITILYAMKADNLKDDDPDSRYKYDAVSIAIKALEQKPKTGYWIDINGIYAKCSNCNEEIYITGAFKYCPNCGAKMKVGE